MKGNKTTVTSLPSSFLINAISSLLSKPWYKSHEAEWLSTLYVPIWWTLVHQNHSIWLTNQTMTWVLLMKVSVLLQGSGLSTLIARLSSGSVSSCSIPPLYTSLWLAEDCLAVDLLHPFHAQVPIRPISAASRHYPVSCITRRRGEMLPAYLRELAKTVQMSSNRTYRETSRLQIMIVLVLFFF